MATATNPMSGPGIPLESERIFTPLGIRFWDITLDLPVDDGLVVRLQVGNLASPVLNAIRTSSGVYAFFGLPGLRAAEYPAITGIAPARTYTYVVTVQDTLGRYLPAVLVYTLDQTGAILENGVPSAPGPRLAYLFSAPGRPSLPGLAGVSAYLIDHASQAAAAWAVVKIQVGTDPEIWTGIADDAGRALVMVRFPVAQSLEFGSPPGAGQVNLFNETWPLTVQVQYSPDQLGYPLANAPNAVWPWTDTPNLKDILNDQQPATIWADPATPVLQFTAALTLGQDLVLRSATGSPLSSISSSLNISRGTSPI